MDNNGKNSDNTAEEIPPDTAEEVQLARESFIRYRNAGIALSAILITLAVILFKLLLDENITETFWTSICKATLILTIILALFIQLFNYLGAKEQAHTYLKLVIIKHEQLDATQLNRKTVPDYYNIADAFVYISTVLLLISLFIWILITPYI